MTYPTSYLIGRPRTPLHLTPPHAAPRFSFWRGR